MEYLSLVLSLTAMVFSIGALIYTNQEYHKLEETLDHIENELSNYDGIEK
jgi:hypothetical protein